MRDKLIHSRLPHSSYVVGVHNMLRIRQDDMQFGSANVDTSSAEVFGQSKMTLMVRGTIVKGMRGRINVHSEAKSSSEVMDI